MYLLVLKVILLAILLGIAVYSDTKNKKIRNYVTAPAMAAGLSLSFASDGFAGLRDSVAGLLTPVILLFVFYALRMLGAGDLKLLGAVGAIMGCKFALYALACSFIVGGAIGIIILIVRRNAVERFRHLFNYLRACFLSLKLLEYQCFDRENSGLFRFTYAIAGGVIAAVCIFPVLWQGGR